MASLPHPPRRSVIIQGLIATAPDGATVTIPYGEYHLEQGLLIQGRKNLTLTAEPGTRILVDDVFANVLTIKGSLDVRIENLYLSHLKPLEEYNCHGDVVHISNCTKMEIVNCELNGCGAIGVYARGGRELMIHNCFIHHNSFNAFYFQDAGDIAIQSCIIEDNGNFLQLHNTQNLEMRDNVIRRNGGYWEGTRDMCPGLYQTDKSDSK